MENDFTQTAPSRFLQRIADYPEPVQVALSAEVTDEIMTRFLRVLHGAAPDPAALPSAGNAPGIADALLSRLITSKRFLARMKHFMNLLHIKDDSRKNEFDDIFKNSIIPLAEDDTPYIYKIDEALAADPHGALAEVLTPIKDLVALLRSRGETTPEGWRLNSIDGKWLAELILEAGLSRDVSLLNAVTAALDMPLELTDTDPTTTDALNATPISASGRLFLQKILPMAAQFSALDIDTMRSIAAAGVTELTMPRPLTVILTDTPSAEAEARWSKLVEQGLVEKVVQGDPETFEPGEGQLRVASEVQLSPIALAWLSSANLPDGSAAIATERQAMSGTWARQIIGYIDKSASLEIVGLYQSDPKATALPQLQLMLAYLATRTKEEVVVCLPADAYAIVLRLQEDIDLDIYANIENCLIFDSLAELTAAMADATERMRKKPVVIIGPTSSIDPNYIVTSAAKFRARGAAYLTTPLILTYDGESASFRVNLPKQDTLASLAVVEASVLPLSEILDAPDKAQTFIDMGIFMKSEGFAVCYASPSGMEQPSLERIQRRLSARQWTLAEQEALFLINPPDFFYPPTQSSIPHWPIEALLTDIEDKFQQFQKRLSGFLASPRSRSAAQILKQLSLRSKEALMLSSQLDAFALRLSECPEILLDLPPDLMVAFFDLGRQCASSDMIAANLSVYTHQICDKDIGVIIPLFEFLACGLKPEDLRVSLAYVADVRPKNRRYMFRVAECIRRYGDEPLMVQYLAIIKQNDPFTLQEAQFARCFHEILSSSRLKTITAVLGADTVRNIAATVSFADHFKQAVLSQDKDSMKQLVTDPIPDFLKWVDGLRALSNELRAMASEDEAFAIPGITGLYRRKLAAVIFADKVTLRSFAAQGFLDGPGDLDVVGQYILGNNAPLTEFIERAFEGSDAPAFEVSGSTTAEVFSHAQDALAKASPPGSSTTPDAPLVSVIMSAFNPDIELMRLSIASVFAQTHSAVELFVVDDASEPESSAAIQAMLAEFPQVDYTRISVNSGPYVGRNLALAKAKGQFIAIQDADDWSHPKRFETQLAAFAESKELKLVTSQHVRIDRFGGVQLEAGFAVFGDGPMTSMFRRDLFDEVGGFARIRSRGDVEMRERIRAYYGSHAIRELQMPCMLCFADSATLSQKTKSEAKEYLQIFRTNITRKRDFASLRRAGEKLTPEYSLVVPMPLRPQTELVK